MRVCVCEGVSCSLKVCVCVCVCESVSVYVFTPKLLAAVTSGTTKGCVKLTLILNMSAVFVFFMVIKERAYPCSSSVKNPPTVQET